MKHRLKKVAESSDPILFYRGNRPGIAAQEAESVGDLGLIGQVVCAPYGLDENRGGYA